MHFNVSDRYEGEQIVLRRYSDADAPAMKECIAASFAELHEWMPFAAEPPTDESALEFVAGAAREFGGEASANFAITLRDDGRLIGSCGLMPRPDSLEIGYCVDSRFAGRGVATETARLLTDAAFENAHVERVRIACDEANARSAAVPRRLGFTLEGIVDNEKLSPSDTGRSMVWVMQRGDWS
jgi:RimJ/RimL family protein N-acetyltransferase